jgi:hypothetical protein
MPAKQDLETVATLLETMLSVRQADERAVKACLRLVKQITNELEEPTVAEDDESTPDAEKGDDDLGPAWSDDDSKKRAHSAMDQAMGVTELRSGGCAFEGGVQTLGVQQYVSKQ